MKRGRKVMVWIGESAESRRCTDQLNNSLSFAFDNLIELFLGSNMCVSQTFETLCIGATVFKQPSEVMQIEFHRCGRTNGRRPLSGLGRRKPDLDHISQVQRSVVNHLDHWRQACAGRFDPAAYHGLCECEFAHKILEKDWKRRRGVVEQTPSRRQHSSRWGKGPTVPS